MYLGGFCTAALSIRDQLMIFLGFFMTISGVVEHPNNIKGVKKVRSAVNYRISNLFKWK